MATLTHSSATTSTHTNLWANVLDFSEKAEFNRFGWSATVLAIQGCVLSPVLLLVMAYFGGGDWQFLTSMLCFLGVLVSILSASPLKYVFSAFGISAVLHIVMLAMDLL